MSRLTPTLGKKERLKSRKQIDALFNGGRKIQQFPFRLLYAVIRAEKEEVFPVRAGFTVSSRNFPLAVDRNRLKRMMRESYRGQKAPLTEAALKTGNRVELFLIFTGREIVDRETIENNLSTILRKLAREINENIPKPA